MLFCCLTLSKAVNKISLVSFLFYFLELLYVMQENSEPTKKLIGIEVTNTKIKAVCLGENGSVIDTHKTTFDSEEEISSQLINAIKELKQKFGDFEKIGIAIPGLLNRQTNRIAFSTRMPEIAELDLINEIQNSTNVKVYIKNDANAAAYAEHILGAGRGSKDMFYVTLGAGIGGALILDDKIWHGKSGFAGELGHIVINSEGMKLEDVASAESILRRTRSWIHKDSTTSLNTIDENMITISDVVREAKNEDDFATLILERTGTYIGTVIAGVINLLNIEKIVIGGEIMTAEEIVLNAIVGSARDLSFMPSFQTVEIVAGELGENASAIGVAVLSETQI